MNEKNFEQMMMDGFDVETTMDIYDFANLMLAMTTFKKDVINLWASKEEEKQYARLPLNFKQVIESILTTKNGWKDEFAPLINMDEYFENHFVWEMELGNAIVEIAEDLNTPIVFDLETDVLSIEYSKETVETIMAQYSIETRELMDHFVNLLLNIIYTREFQESHLGYNQFGRAIETMCEIQNREQGISVDDILNPEEPFVKKIDRKK